MLASGPNTLPQLLGMSSHTPSSACSQIFVPTRKRVGENDDEEIVQDRLSARNRREAAARLSKKDILRIGMPTGYESDDENEPASEPDGEDNSNPTDA